MTKYKLKIENETHVWESQFITGKEVRSVGAGIPDSMDLFLKVKGNMGRLIQDDEKIDLSEDKGIEKFYAQDSKSEAG